MSFARFMSSPAGRMIRIVAGIALILIGFFVTTGTTSLILYVVGAVPLLAGIVNVCVFAPLFGGPFRGQDAR
jgi:hypothetical protein